MPHNTPPVKPVQLLSAIGGLIAIVGSIGYIVSHGNAGNLPTKLTEIEPEIERKLRDVFSSLYDLRPGLKALKFHFWQSLLLIASTKKDFNLTKHQSSFPKL